MRLVVLESPFSAETAAGVQINVNYARACVRHCLSVGDSAIASHLLYTQPGILHDTIPEERAFGIKAGHAWIKVCDAVVVYTDHGISRGMGEGIAVAEAAGKPVEYRKIFEEPKP